LLVGQPQRRKNSLNIIGKKGEGYLGESIPPRKKRCISLVYARKEFRVSMPARAKRGSQV